jgi:hypothetical protein
MWRNLLLIGSVVIRRLINSRAGSDLVNRPTEELDLVVGFAALDMDRFTTFRDRLAVVFGIRLVGLLI